jgi:hypothetical protein
MNQVIQFFNQCLQRRWILLILISFSTIAINAQKENINGTIVTLSGETLTVKIKPAQEDKLAKGISVYNDTTEEFKKLTAKDIKYFKYEDSEYFVKTVDGKDVFLEREIDGPATLYTYHYKVEKGNDRVDATDYYVEKKETGSFKLMSKKTFKTEMADFYSDDEALSEKIKGGYYSYDEKEATVEEYNDWVAQGKPGKTWRKEDGNYTKDNGNGDQTNNTNNNNNNYNNTNQRTQKNSYYDGSKLALDIPLLADYSIISSDPIVTQVGVKNTSNGFGYNVGIGLRWQLSKTLFWRNGLNFRMKRFHSNYAATDGSTTPPSTVYVDEYGSLYYFGVYSALHLEFGNFILGAGFDISFGSVYWADYSIKDNSGQVVYTNTKPESQSIISQKNNKNNFNAQFDLNLILGYKIRLANGACNLKPIFQYSIPLVSIFDVPVQGLGPPSFYNKTGVHGYLINLGVIVDIGFPPKPKAKSLLNDY